MKQTLHDFYRQILHVLRRIVPHYFAKEPIPTITHSDLLLAIEKVKQAPSAEVAITMALDLLRTKYHSMRFLTYVLFYRWFETDPNTLWERKGYLHCTHLNFLCRVLLVRSGWFEERDIQLGYSLVWHISPHQYLKVRLHGAWIAIDPWHYNTKRIIGKYATGFTLKQL